MGEKDFGSWSRVESCLSRVMDLDVDKGATCPARADQIVSTRLELSLSATTHPPWDVKSTSSPRSIDRPMSDLTW